MPHRGQNSAQHRPSFRRARRDETSAYKARCRCTVVTGIHTPTSAHGTTGGSLNTSKSSECLHEKANKRLTIPIVQSVRQNKMRVPWHCITPQQRYCGVQQYEPRWLFPGRYLKSHQKSRRTERSALTPLQAADTPAKRKKRTAEHKRGSLQESILPVSGGVIWQRAWVKLPVSVSGIIPAACTACCATLF